MKNFFLLKNPEFIKWCKFWITDLTLAITQSDTKLKPFAKIEKVWWNTLIQSEGNKQWTTLLCQEAVREALIALWYKNVKNSRKFKSSLRNKWYDPDLESDEAVWEVKWRNWTTPGTAWEKILWTPLKYSEIPKLYWKPLKIVLVWYQEWEAKNGFACWDLVNKSWWRTQEADDILSFYKTKDIEYIAFTDLLEKLWL